jgi:hypothetical protein
VARGVEQTPILRRQSSVTFLASHGQSRPNVLGTLARWHEYAAASVETPTAVAYDVHYISIWKTLTA